MTNQENQNLENIPIVNWPEESGDYRGDYRVVQILETIDRDRRLLRFPTSVFQSHADIVQNFMNELGITCNHDRHENPIFPDDDYMLVGAGWCYIDLDRRIARFYGRSGGYNIGINSRHLELLEETLERLLPEWDIRG